MKELYGNGKLQKHAFFGAAQRIVLGIQEENLEFLQNMSVLTGLPIKRLIDLYHPDCVRNGRELYDFWG